MKDKTLVILAVFSAMGASACSGGNASSSSSKNVPNSWYQLPEEEKKGSIQSKAQDEAQIQNLKQTVETIFSAQGRALEAGMRGDTLQSVQSPSHHPADWVPWRAEYFMTDLALSSGGLLGSLTMKGSATVRAFWRKQFPSAHQLQSLELHEDKTVISLNSETEPEDIQRQLEPAIQAVVESGKIEDASELRRNLLKAAREFQAVASGLGTTQADLPWWVSRFRLDVTADASGHVTTIGTVGGEVRFRFEWHRVKKHVTHTAHLDHLISGQQKVFQDDLKNFVVNMAYDLDDAFQEITNLDFQAHQIRMGVGISAKGHLGVVKGSAGVVGQIYFTRNVKRPKQHNPFPPAMIYMIEKDPKPAHLHFAKTHNITFELDKSAPSTIGEVVYQLDREAFKDGLRKAASISSFFAERAAATEVAGWKIYELRTAFDASIGGDLDLVTLAGAVTAQVSFFNQKY